MKKSLVLIINGAGTNGAELKSLYNHLNHNEKYFVYYPTLLPGSFVGDYFPKSTTKDFIRFIDETIEIINEDFDKVYLIGYSLGASTACIIAAKSPKVSKIVLIAPIIHNPNFNKFLRGLTKSLAKPSGLSRIQKIFYAEFLRRFRRLPKIHLWYVQLYLRYARKYINEIHQKTLIIETLNDEVVKKKSVDYIANLHVDQVERYPVDSSHFLFFDREARTEVIQKVSSFLKEEL